MISSRIVLDNCGLSRTRRWARSIGPRAHLGRLWTTTATIRADIRAVVNSAEFADRVRHLGISPAGNTPQELEAWMRREMLRWGEIAKAANIKADDQ